MTASALGLIETFGLIAAIEAADAAAKAANVTVLGYENAKGGGRIAVKLVGDVGAVKAAVAAGSGAALRVGKLAGTLVIPRPHEEIAALVAQVDRGRVPVRSARIAPAGDAPVSSNGDGTPSDGGQPLNTDAPIASNGGNAPVDGGQSSEAELTAQPDGAPVVAADTAVTDDTLISSDGPVALLDAPPEPRKPAAPRRPKQPKGEPPATSDTGEVEG